ncbi:hypothetical protein DFJ63DRAFT_321006 [Scheffersomyces coipomensis]|uniref:uncharacterized protein n=1 Tax=Scheffersomyces coipomensis TaxID=1788519 RepID=UPI00315DBECA
MSESVKQFHSKSLDHFLKYSVVSYIVNYIYAITLVKQLYEGYISSILTFINTHLSSIDLIYTNLTFVDATLDSILTVFDQYVTQFIFKNKYVSLINNYLISINNSNTYVKFDQKFESTESNEFIKFFYIINTILINLKLKINTSTNHISNELISTYNQELKSTTAEANYIAKNIQASYNTGLKTIKSLNDEFITPLKIQTTDYLGEVATSTKIKADSLINEAKQQIITPINGKVEGVLNGSAPVVSASA